MEALPAPLLTDSSPDLDLRRVWATVARSAWLILGCVLLSLGAGVVAVRRMDPVYQATASIRIDPRGESSPAAAFYGVTSDNTNLMATAMEVLTSRSLANDVADTLGLRLQLDEPRRTPRSAVIASAHVDSLAPLVSYRLLPRGAGSVSVRDPPHRHPPSPCGGPLIGPPRITFPPHAS